jgi:hypothetical protein
MDTAFSARVRTSCSREGPSSSVWMMLTRKLQKMSTEVPTWRDVVCGQKERAAQRYGEGDAVRRSELLSATERETFRFSEGGGTSLFERWSTGASLE